jgi:hypothetical protein
MLEPFHLIVLLVLKSFRVYWHILMQDSHPFGNTDACGRGKAN